MRMKAVVLPPISGVHQVRLTASDSIDLYPIILIPADSAAHAKRIADAINSKDN